MLAPGGGAPGDLGQSGRGPGHRPVPARSGRRSAPRRTASHSRGFRRGISANRYDQRLARADGDGTRRADRDVVVQGAMGGVYSRSRRSWSADVGPVRPPCHQQRTSPARPGLDEPSAASGASALERRGWPRRTPARAWWSRACACRAGAGPDDPAAHDGGDCSLGAWSVPWSIGPGGSGVSGVPPMHRSDRPSRR